MDEEDENFSSTPPLLPPPDSLSASDVDNAFALADHNESLFPQLEGVKEHQPEDEYRNIMVFKVCVFSRFTKCH